MLYILGVAASTLVGMICIILVSVSCEAVLDSFKFCRYGNVRGYVGEFSVPTGEEIVICIVICFIGVCGSGCILTADDSNLGFLTVNDECYCVGVERALVLLKGILEVLFCFINNTLFGYDKIFSDIIIVKNLLNCSFCFLSNVCAEKTLK